MDVGRYRMREEQTHGTRRPCCLARRVVWSCLYTHGDDDRGSETACRTLRLHLSMSARSRSNHGGQQRQPEEDNPMRLASDVVYRPAAEQ